MSKTAVLEELLPDELSDILDHSNEGIFLYPKGRSMLPFIREGVDKVRLGRVEGLRKGDIVLAYFDSRYLLHRIYALDGERITLMGDGNLQGKEYCSKADVKAVVKEIVTREGRVRQPGRAWLWRNTLGCRKYLLKAYRKWNKLKHTTI